MVEVAGRNLILADLKQLYRHLLSRIGRKGAFVLLLVVLLGGSAFAGWKTGFFEELYFQYNRAEIMVIVEDSKTGRPLVGVSVEADGQVLETGEQGTVFFERLQTGEATFRISLPGFKDFFQTVGLNRGPNKELIFSLQIATAELSGTVVDHVDGIPVAGAKVVAAGAEATTDEDGKFVLEEVIIGTPEVTISKEGYYDFSQTVELVKDVAKDIGELKLLAKGKVVFVSDRDGKNAIYWVKFDGSDLGKIWENKAGFDDTQPHLSPDKQRIIFLSNRDNQKDERPGAFYPKDFPYYNDLTGKALQRLSFDANPILHGWLADGSGFVYSLSPWTGGVLGKSREEIKIVEVPALTVSTLVKSSDFGDYGDFNYIIFSPKSDWIAFGVHATICDEETDEEHCYYSDKAGTYIIRPDGTGLKKIASIDGWDLEYLHVSEDGKKVIYKEHYSSEYYAYDIAAGTTTKTSAPSGLCGYYSSPGVYSSAQKLRAFVDYRGGKNDVYVSKKDCTAERRVTSAGGEGWTYFAGPGDRYLTYQVYRLLDSGPIYIIGLKRGSEPLKVTDIASGFAGVVPE